MIKKLRLDHLLIDRKLAPNRSRARALIMAGKVYLDGRPVIKAGASVPSDSSVEIIRGGAKYVSRGGDKLEGALEHWILDVRNMVALDVGASTGGFTDCLLQRGAKQVFAVDVGYGQLDWKLRRDKRVINLERTNARYMKQEDIGIPMDFAVIDVSFISLEHILPPVITITKKGGTIIALIKPQFEVGKGEVGKGGVVKDPSRHQETILKICRCSTMLDSGIQGLTRSPLKGPKGNAEFFIYLKKGLPSIDEEIIARLASELAYGNQNSL